ncbi:MAG: alkaline phosphatase family protein [Acidobacteriota bacterium]|nr:alkaline phosphatase family protein [Acidobacteriota bacterium]
MTKLRRTPPLVVIFASSLLLVIVFLASTVAQRLPRAHESNAETFQRQARTPKATSSESGRTRLVLLIVVDQFRYDYLEKYGDLFVEGGLSRLMRKGASWTQANYDHMPTYTAPGHATLMTGTWPSEHGIIANDWFDRETGTKVSSVTDNSTLLLGGREGDRGKSPRRLLASTVGDELRLATNDRSKVIGISVKDRSAILPAGRHASAAYWESNDNGNFVSSNYYFNSLPVWVDNFNQKHMADSFFGMRWDRLLPESEYIKRVGADAEPWENLYADSHDTKTFPHVITGGLSKPGFMFYKSLDYTPFSNDLLLAFAKEAIVKENLGGDDDADILTISFSANDYVGHRFGPYSQEAMDVTLRMDRNLANLLDFVDGRVSLQNTIVVFTADHGVAPVPEHAIALNLPGHRIDYTNILRTIKDAIKARYGRASGEDNTADYIQSFQHKNETRDGYINGNVYLNMSALGRDGVNADEIERFVGQAAMSVPGLGRYFTRAQLEAGSIAPADPVARRVFHGYQPQRSGDVVLVAQPYSITVEPLDEPTDFRWTATHGSPYSYDTHVPLIIMGRGFSAGRYEEPAAPSDIAPTLATALGIQAPSNSTGRVLMEARTERRRRRAER